MNMKACHSDSFVPKIEKLIPRRVSSHKIENISTVAKKRGIFKYIEVELPLRIKSLSNETSEHWTTRSKRNRSQSAVVKYYLQNQIYELKLPCRITLIRIAPRAFDGDNLIIAFKKIRDTIAWLFFPETKPGQADSYECFLWDYSQEKGEPKEYGIKIRIEEI